jgi:predicted ATP-binding protein involved in virulence
MYLEEMRILNYGAIEDLSYKFSFNDDGTPMPIVLVGRNGVGKTLLLSNIIHSLIEMKRQQYNELSEVDGTNYYRLGTQEYIKNGKNYSYINYKYTANSSSTDLAVNNFQYFKTSEYKEDVHKNIAIGDKELIETGFSVKTIKPKDKAFDNNVFLYFPVDRYYVPKWLNKKNEKLRFITDNSNWVGYSNSDMIRDNILEDIESWILDVIIDKLLYEEKDPLQIVGANGQVNSIKNYNGKNTSMQSHINSILTQLFARNTAFVSARIGISSKKPRKISVMGKLKGTGEDVEFVPNFSNLSSGEIMILAMFCSILKEYDRIAGDVAAISDISGIVLIDEIDLHLHSDFAKEILPNIIKMFPKIQFIVSSHSPFFLLGMKDAFNDRCAFLSLPTGTIMNNIENFEEIRKCYDMLDKNYHIIVSDLEQYKAKIASLTKPILITEGKTDWKHLKNALNMFKASGEFAQLDIDFLEYTDENMGDTKLETMLINFAKIPNDHQIIGVFDDDTVTGKKHKSKFTFGNNVFGISIFKDEYSNGISIEFLYSESDIKLSDANGRRLYLSSEFTDPKRVLISDPTISTRNNAVDAFYKTGIVKIIDDKVYDAEEKNIALTKDDYASNILNHTPPFDTVNIENFRSIFQMIEDIINQKN